MSLILTHTSMICVCVCMNSNDVWAVSMKISYYIGDGRRAKVASSQMLAVCSTSHIWGYSESIITDQYSKRLSGVRPTAAPLGPLRVPSKSTLNHLTDLPCLFWTASLQPDIVRFYRFIWSASTGLSMEKRVNGCLCVCMLSLGTCTQVCTLTKVHKV